MKSTPAPVPQNLHLEVKAPNMSNDQYHDTDQTSGFIADQMIASYAIENRIKRHPNVAKSILQRAGFNFPKSLGSFTAPVGHKDVLIVCSTKELRWIKNEELQKGLGSSLDIRTRPFAEKRYIEQKGNTDVLPLLEHLTGEDRNNVLLICYQHFRLSNAIFTPYENFNYSSGSYGIDHQAIPPIPSVLADGGAGVCYEFDKQIFVTDSAGKATSILYYYRCGNKLKMLPISAFKQNDRYHQVGYVDYGLTKQSFSLIYRQELSQGHAAMIFLAPNIYDAVTINHRLKELGISGIIATSWLGGVKGIRNSDWIYIQDQVVVVGHSNISKNYSNQIIHKLEEVNATALQLSITYDELLELIKSDEAQPEKIVEIFNNTSRYRYRQVKRTRDTPELNKLKTLVKPTKKLISSGSDHKNETKATWLDVLRPDMATLVCGATEIGKTMFLYGLMTAVANNLPFLNIEAGARKRVIYLDAETAEPEAQNRLKRIQQAMPSANHDVDFIFTRDLADFDLDDEEDRNNLTGFLEQYDIVVIDNLLSIANKTLRNNSKWEKFKKWCMKLKSAVVLVHHENKEGGTLGVTEIEALTPTVIHLTKDESKENFPGVAQVVTFKKCKADPMLSGNSFTASLEAGTDTSWEFGSPSRQFIDTIEERFSYDIMDYEVGELSETELKVFESALAYKKPFTRIDVENWSGLAKTSANKIINNLIKFNLVKGDKFTYQVVLQRQK